MIMPIKLDTEYEFVHWDNNFQTYKIVQLGSKRPKKEEMTPGHFYLYFSSKGPIFAVINSQDIVQRVQLESILLGGDPHNISDAIREGNLVDTQARPLFNAADNAVNSMKIQDLGAQYYFLRHEFETELELRDKYNRTLPLPKGFAPEEWKANCDKFKKEANNLLKSIHAAIPKDYGKPLTIQQQLLGKKDPAVELALVNQVLERARISFEVPAAAEKKAYVENLDQMQLLSQELLGRYDRKIQGIGISLKQLIGISLIIGGAILLACPITMPFAVVGIIATIATFLPILSPSLMGLCGVYCLVQGREKGVTKALSNLKDTAKTMNEAINMASTPNGP